MCLGPALLTARMIPSLSIPGNIHHSPNEVRAAFAIVSHIEYHSYFRRDNIMVKNKSKAEPRF